MIFVLCLMALIMALGLSVLYAASLTSTQAGRRRERQHCYEQALTFSEFLQSLLPDEETEELLDDTQFHQFILRFLDEKEGNGAPTYEDHTSYSYSMKELDDTNYGPVTISVEKAPLIPSEDVLLEEGVTYLDQELRITVTVTLGDSMSSITTVFYRQITKEPGETGETVSRFLYQRREQP